MSVTDSAPIQVERTAREQKVHDLRQKIARIEVLLIEHRRRGDLGAVTALTERYVRLRGELTSMGFK